MECLICGFQNDSEAKFCQGCNTLLGDEKLPPKYETSDNRLGWSEIIVLIAGFLLAPVAAWIFQGMTNIFSALSGSIFYTILTVMYLIASYMIGTLVRYEKVLIDSLLFCLGPLFWFVITILGWGMNLFAIIVFVTISFLIVGVANLTKIIKRKRTH